MISSLENCSLLAKLAEIAKLVKSTGSTLPPSNKQKEYDEKSPNFIENQR